MDTPTGSPSAMNDASRRVKDAASSVTDSAKETINRQAEAGVQRASGAAQDLASALRGAADNVSNDHEWVGNALYKAADGIQRATNSISGGDFSGVLRDINGFARRQPALFLGACLAVGFATARVGKTAMEHQSSTSPEPRSI